MKQIARLAAVEARPFFRDPAAWLITLLLPTLSRDALTLPRPRPALRWLASPAGDPATGTPTPRAARAGGTGPALRDAGKFDELVNCSGVGSFTGMRLSIFQRIFGSSPHVFGTSSASRSDSDFQSGNARTLARGSHRCQCQR
jgi:hypothetical protein